MQNNWQTILGQKFRRGQKFRLTPGPKGKRRSQPELTPALRFRPTSAGPSPLIIFAGRGRTWVYSVQAYQVTSGPRRISFLIKWHHYCQVVFLIWFF